MEKFNLKRALWFSFLAGALLSLPALGVGGLYVGIASTFVIFLLSMIWMYVTHLITNRLGNKKLLVWVLGVFVVIFMLWFMISNYRNLMSS